MGIIKSILLATDFRQSSQEAAVVTARLATAFGSRVTVLHVAEAFQTWPVTPFENQDLLAKQLSEQKVDVAEFLVHAGPPADTIISKARELEVDLLVIGAGEKVRDGRAALGPIAESILGHAESPVLAVNLHAPKLQFNTILCAVDQSRLSRRALDDGIQLARSFGAKLVVLSVVPEVSWLIAAAQTGQLASAKLEHETKWVTEFEEFLAAVSFAGVEWKRELRHGSPHEQIATAAREIGADLLVMGATGRTGILRVLLGSVTRRVLEQLPCSLLLVKDQTVFDEQFLLDIDVIDRLVDEGHSKLRVWEPAEAAGKFRQALSLDHYSRAALDGLITACEQLGQSETAQRYRKRLERLQQRK